MADPQTGQSKTEPQVPEKVTVTVESTDVDQNIPHPTFELYRHTLMRGANLGSFLSLVLGPPVLLFRGVRKPTELLHRLGNICLKGTILGIGFGAATTLGKTWNDQDEQIWDRCYRLRYNEGQVRMDKFTYGGAVIGGLAGAAGYPTGGLLGGLQGASIGVGLAVLAHVWTKPKKKEEETKTESKKEE